MHFLLLLSYFTAILYCYCHFILLFLLITQNRIPGCVRRVTELSSSVSHSLVLIIFRDPRLQFNNALSFISLIDNKNTVNHSKNYKLDNLNDVQ